MLLKIDLDNEKLVVVPETKQEADQLGVIAFTIMTGRIASRQLPKKRQSDESTFIAVQFDTEAIEKLTH